MMCLRIGTEMGLKKKTEPIHSRYHTIFTFVLGILYHNHLTPTTKLTLISVDFLLLSTFTGDGGQIKIGMRSAMHSHLCLQALCCLPGFHVSSSKLCCCFFCIVLISSLAQPITKVFLQCWEDLRHLQQNPIVYFQQCTVTAGVGKTV